MRSVNVLPDGYSQIFRLDLQKDKKTALIVNALAFVLMIAVCVIGHLIVPIGTLFDMEQGTVQYLARLLVICVGLIVYMILHELVHGITMKYMGTKKVKYGFTGLYAYAGSDDYYYRRPYIVIALAPVVVWGALLLVVNCFVSGAWFWVVFIIQATNISGAAGDLYVVWRFCKMPEDILVRDTGVAMTVYSRREQEDTE